MAELTFRDFAGAVMANDGAAAARVLEVLLGLAPDRASAAAAHFQGEMGRQGQAFMMKAMGLRGAVTSGNPDEIRPLLVDCFGLDGADLDGALAALAARYRRP